MRKGSRALSTRGTNLYRLMILNQRTALKSHFQTLELGNVNFFVVGGQYVCKPKLLVGSNFCKKNPPDFTDNVVKCCF